MGGTEIVIHSSNTGKNVSSVQISKGQFFFGTIDGYGRGLCLKVHERVILINVDETRSFTDPHPIRGYIPVRKVTIKAEIER